MSLYADIVVKIIQGQEAIIGPVAVEQAEQVSSLKVDWPKHEVTISGDETQAINQLIEQYKALFGQISVEVSKQSAGALISQLPADRLPAALK